MPNPKYTAKIHHVGNKYAFSLQSNTTALYYLVSNNSNNVTHQIICGIYKGCPHVPYR